VEAAPVHRTDDSGAFELARFASVLGADAERTKCVRELHAWLVRLDPDVDLAALSRELRWFSRWIRARTALPSQYARLPATEFGHRRLWLLLDALDGAPPLAPRFYGAISKVLVQSEALRLFEVGLPNPRGLLAELADRLARRFVPSARDPRDLAALAGELFPSARDARWLRSVPTELWDRLATRMEFGATRSTLDDAIALCAMRVQALGLTSEIRGRASGASPRESVFFQLPRACDALLLEDGNSADAGAHCHVLIDACRAEAGIVASHLEEFGVSVDVVYRLEVISANLDRLAALIRTRGAPAPVPQVDLFAGMVEAGVRDRSLHDLWRTNVHLLARKIIEHAGRTGEHYITRTRRDWLGMIASAGGGGVLTALTTVFKYLVQWAGLPLFVEGVLASSNYALSFLVMQALGLTLATKQPSMTAAALAAALKAEPAPQQTADLQALVALIARICRSQLAAALGNLGLVIPSAWLFDLWWRRRTGHPFLSESAATHSLHSLHPLHSGTIGFAVLTGVLLWLSSLGAGWLENWATYRRIPEAIAEHRLGRVVGRGTMRWLADKLRRGMSGIGGNIALGALLGMVPVIGRFLGLPLEVRHVTLSTGSLTLAASSLGSAASHAMPAAACGIVIIGMLNFGVSFLLALGVALRARAVERGGARLLLAVVRRFARSPAEFVFPSGREE
jgi:site-specific recombinase